MLKGLLLCSVLLLPVAAEGMDAGEATTLVLDSLAEEYAGCAAYLALLSRAAPGAGEGQDSRTEQAITYALVYSGRERDALSARQAVTEKIDQALERMFNESGGDIEHVPALARQHAARCNHALDDPADFAQQILERAISP